MRNCLVALLLKSTWVTVSHRTLAVLANYLTPSIAHDYFNFHKSNVQWRGDDVEEVGVDPLESQCLSDL